MKQHNCMTAHSGVIQQLSTGPKEEDSTQLKLEGDYCFESY